MYWSKFRAVSGYIARFGPPLSTSSTSKYRLYFNQNLHTFLILDFSAIDKNFGSLTP